MKFTATLMATLACTQAIRIEATVDSQVEQRFRDLIDTPWSGNLIEDLGVDPIIPVVVDASDDVFAGLSHASAMQGLALNFAAAGGFGNVFDDLVGGGLGGWSNGIGEASSAMGDAIGLDWL